MRREYQVTLDQKKAIVGRLEDFAAKYWDGWDACLRAAAVPRGTAALWRNAKTRTVPGPRHLIQLAERVQLNPAWLLLKVGQAKLVGDQVPAAFDPWRRLTARGQRLERAHRLVLKTLPQLDALPPVVTHLFVEVVVRWAPLMAHDQDVRRLARHVWKLVEELPQQFGYGHPALNANAPSDRNARRFADHALAMLVTLASAAPAPGEEQVLEKKVEQRRRKRSAARRRNL